MDKMSITLALPLSTRIKPLANEIMERAGKYSLGRYETLSSPSWKDRRAMFWEITSPISPLAIAQWRMTIVHEPGSTVIEVVSANRRFLLYQLLHTINLVPKSSLVVWYVATRDGASVSPSAPALKDLLECGLVSATDMHRMRQYQNAGMLS